MIQNDVLPEFPAYALDLMGAIVEQTDYPLLVTEQPRTGYDSQLRMGSSSHPYHHLICDPAYRQHLVHFLVNAAFKIRRVWELPPEDRLLPIGDARRRLPEDDETELRQRLKGMPDATVRDLSTFLYRGLLQQLTSMPIDIRVEREIAATFVGHAEAQRAYLRRQVADLEPHFAPEIEAFAPARLYSACTAMNIVLAAEAADLAGVKPGQVFRESPHRVLGERLREIARLTDEPGYHGDRALTDAWAEELGLRDWYEWERLDQIRR